MSQEGKPRVSWARIFKLSEKARAELVHFPDDVLKHARESDVNWEYFRVIEKSAFDKAIEALKKVAITGWDCIHCEMSTNRICSSHYDENVDIAREALKELGEVE